jgi:DNA-binding GntR family transcriptional regulator
MSLKSKPSVETKRGGGARRVYEEIRDEILELKIAPGSALDETSLATRFAMSRSPIREALVRLSADGLVETLSNRSTIVKPLEIAQMPRFIEAMDYLQRVVTRLAARNRQDADIAKMTQAATYYDAVCANGSALDLSQANKDFHMAVANAGGNSFLAKSYEQLLDEGRRILHLHYAHVRSRDDKFHLSPEHFDIIDAIREQDETQADRLAHKHTSVFHEQMLDLVKVNYIETFDCEN